MLGTTELGPESVPACAAPLLPPPRPPTNPSVTPIPRPGARVLDIFLPSFHSYLCARQCTSSRTCFLSQISLYFPTTALVITQQTFAGTDLNVSYSALQERIHCVARLHPHYGWCPMNRSAQSDGIAKIIMAHMR